MTNKQTKRLNLILDVREAVSLLSLCSSLKLKACSESIYSLPVRAMCLPCVCAPRQLSVTACMCADVCEDMEVRGQGLCHLLTHGRH